MKYCRVKKDTSIVQTKKTCRKMTRFCHEFEPIICQWVWVALTTTPGLQSRLTLAKIRNLKNISLFSKGMRVHVGNRKHQDGIYRSKWQGPFTEGKIASATIVENKPFTFLGSHHRRSTKIVDDILTHSGWYITDVAKL